MAGAGLAASVMILDNRGDNGGFFIKCAYMPLGPPIGGGDYLGAIRGCVEGDRRCPSLTLRSPDLKFRSTWVAPGLWASKLGFRP